jgi:hypothetical protein
VNQRNVRGYRRVRVAHRRPQPSIVLSFSNTYSAALTRGCPTTSLTEDPDDLTDDLRTPLDGTHRSGA